VTQFNVSFMKLFVVSLKQEKLNLLLLHLPDLRTLCHLEFSEKLCVYIYIYIYIEREREREREEERERKKEKC
jgi:hypothetical protein